MLTTELPKGYAMAIVCGNNRVRLREYELRRDFEEMSDSVKERECKRMTRHYSRCGRIIKLFVKAAS